MKKDTENSLPLDAGTDEIEIDLMDLFFYYWSKKWILIVAFLVGAILAGGITKGAITPKYTATSKIYMVSSSTSKVIDFNDLNIGTSLSQDYAELMKIRPIYQEIIKENNLPYTYDQLLGMVDIAAVGETRILAVSVTSTKPEEAKLVANAVVDKAVTYLPKLMDTSKPHIAERAILPKVQSSPSLAKNTVLGALAALVIALAVFTVLYLMDDTLTSEDDVEKYFGIVPLTVIPETYIKEISDDREAEIKQERIRRRKKREKAKKKLEKQQKKGA